MIERTKRPTSAAAIEPEIAGREIARVAIWRQSAQANRGDEASAAPTMERFRQGAAIEHGDGAVTQAGIVGHRVVDACLLDTLKARGILGVGRPAVSRHSAGLWLRMLFHESGLERAAAVRLDTSLRGEGGDPTRAPLFEKSRRASEALARYQAALAAMERTPLAAKDIDWRQTLAAAAEGAKELRRTMRGSAAHKAEKRRRQRLTQAVREICCWDRLPAGYAAAELRAGFDLLAEIEGADGYMEDENG